MKLALLTLATLPFLASQAHAANICLIYEDNLSQYNLALEKPFRNLRVLKNNGDEDLKAHNLSNLKDLASTLKASGNCTAIVNNIENSHEK